MHIFVDNIVGDNIMLTHDDFRHVAHSLRRSVGHKFVVVPLQQDFYTLCEIISVGKSSLEMTVRQRFEKPLSVGVEVDLAQAVVKGEKMDMIIQKSTELGVRQIIPLLTERVVPDIENKVAAKVLRWQRISREAAMQSERFVLPIVSLPRSLNSCLDQFAAYDCVLCFAERSILPLKTVLGDEISLKRILILVGPEGGFSKKEFDTIQLKNGALVSLGPRILRTETASLAALAIVKFWYGS